MLLPEIMVRGPGVCIRPSPASVRPSSQLSLKLILCLFGSQLLIFINMGPYGTKNFKTLNFAKLFTTKFLLQTVVEMVVPVKCSF